MNLYVRTVKNQEANNMTQMKNKAVIHNGKKA